MNKRRRLVPNNYPVQEDPDLNWSKMNPYFRHGHMELVPRIYC